MVLKFLQVTLHNFGSYGHATVDLTDRGFCLVSGKNNYKPDNALSNGSGKSFIWSGICFALTGETIQGVSSNLKNINAIDEKSYVTLSLKADNDEYEITRSIAPKSDLKIIKNGTDVSGKGLRESEKQLADYLPELTQKLIASICIIGQGMPYKLSSFNPSGRKDVLESLTQSAYMIEDVKNRIEDRLNTINTQLRSYDDTLLVNRTQYNTTKASLEKNQGILAAAKKPDFDKLIAASAAQLKAIQKDIDDATANKKIADGQLEAAQQAALNIKLDKQKVLTEEMTSYTNASAPLKQEKLTAEVTIRNLTAEVTRIKNIKDVCPTCGQPLKGVHKPDTTEQEAKIKSLTESLTPISNKLTDIENKHQNYIKEINAQFESNDLAATEKVNQLKRTVASYINTINDNTQSFNVEKENYNKLVYDRDNWDKSYQKLVETIEAEKAELTRLDGVYALNNTAKLDLDQHATVVKKMETLTKRDFRGYLLTNIINYIDKKAKDYSDIVFGNRDLAIYLDGNNINISYGQKLIDSLSGGEKQRVDLILQLAIRNMLQVYLNTTSNILVLDEVTDFLDKQSCEAIMQLFENELADVESVFIVSHHADTLPIATETELHIVKNENGISEIV